MRNWKQRALETEESERQQSFSSPQANAFFEQNKLKRDVQREALQRLESAARSAGDFENVIAWWDRLDANRERRERYHEIARSGDQLPLDFGADRYALIFPGTLNGILQKQIRNGDFLDAIFFCPYEIHQLVSAVYLSEMLLKLPDSQKEILFLWAILQYSAVRIAAIRGQTDRNIRKIRNTLLHKLQKQALMFLTSCQRSLQEMTLEEKRFLKANGIVLDAEKDASYNRNRGSFDSIAKVGGQRYDEPV